MKISKKITDPFRAWIIDDFLPHEVAEKLYSKFPDANQNWYKYDNIFEKKSATDKLTLLPELFINILTVMNTNVFLEPLEEITEIKGLISDPWFRGGGLHQIYPGGKLDVHADFNWHTHLNLHRRLNVILYLNKDWEPGHGGELELWDKNMTECKLKIEPILNRLVIFETTDFSYHGHPNPYQGPSTRKSLAWYYYTTDRPAHELSNPHSTLFKKRPQDQTTEEIEEFRIKRGTSRQTPKDKEV